MKNIIIKYQELGKCSGCEKETEVTTYYAAKETPFSLCENCKVAYLKKNFQVEKKYSITDMQYKRMLVEQKGVCAVCGKPETAKSNSGRKRLAPLAVDHDHTTGQIRGLLCNNCNVALGMLEEDPDRMEALARYIRKFK